MSKISDCTGKTGEDIAATVAILTCDDLGHILDTVIMQAPNSPLESFRAQEEGENHRHCEYRTRRFARITRVGMRAICETTAMGM